MKAIKVIKFDRTGILELFDGEHGAFLKHQMIPKVIQRLSGFNKLESLFWKPWGWYYPAELLGWDPHLELFGWCCCPGGLEGRV